MSALVRKKVYGPLVGGLSDKLSPIMIKDNEGAELVNFQVSDRGILEKVKGFTKDHAPFPDDADSFIRFMLNYKKGSTVDILLMAARDDGNTNATYKVDFKKTTGDGTSSYIGHTAGTNASFTNGNTAVTGAGTTWLSHLKAGDKIKATSHADGVYAEIQTVNSDTSITLTANYSGATAANVAYIARIITHKDFVPRGVVFNNKAVITNGSEKAMTFDNETLNLLTDADAPRGYYIEAHKSRVFMAGTASYPSRLFWSATNDEATWDATSIEDVFPQDNSTIIAIKSFGDSLIVLKNTGKIYQVMGNFDQDAVGEVDFIRKVDVIENVGTISEKTPVVHDNFLFFMTSTGMYRLDQRMYMEKVSYNADTFISGLNFTSGPVSNKSYTFDSSSQWNDGTHLGVYAREGNLVLPFYSHTTSAVLEPSTNGPSVFSSEVDNNNDMHVAYVNTSGNVVYYTVESETNTKSAETTVYSGGLATHCSVSFNPSANTPGIAYGTSASLIYLTEYSGGAWGAAENITQVVNVNTLNLNDEQVWGFKYGYDGDKFLLISFSSADLSGVTQVYSGFYVIKKVGSSWNYCSGSTSTGGTKPVYNGCMVADNTNNKIFAAFSYYDHSSSSKRIKLTRVGQDSGTGEDTVGPAQTSDASTTYSGEKFFIGIDSTGAGSVAFTWPTLYADNRVLYQSMAGATATLVAATSSFKGFWVEGSTKVVWYTTGTGSSVTEKILNGATTITYSTTGGASTSTTANFGSAQNQNSTRITTLSYLTQDSGVVKCYQLSANGVHTTDEYSDATLTSWGTLEATETLNGNTSAYTVALATVSPAASFNTVLNGQVISSDATKIFVIAKATLTMGAFAPLEISSLILNYVGTGVDAKQPVGFSFDTELYYAMGTVADTANSKVLIFDTEEKFLKTTYPVSSFERFKNKLYAGKSTNGDLLILRTGYSFAGSAYSADFQSREDFLDAIELEKDIYKFYVLYEVKSTGTFDFSYRTNSFATSGGTSWTTTTVDQTQAGIAEIPVGQKCRSIQFRVENDGADEQTAIIAVILVYGFLNIR